MLFSTTKSTLLVLSLLLLTTLQVDAASEKSCKAKASRAAEKYVTCYLRAEEKKANKRPSAFRSCLKTFQRKYNQVRKRSGCKRVLPKSKEVAKAMKDDCLELGYDGNTCIQDAATLIGAGEVTCCNPEDFIFCFIGNAVCCSDGQYSCPNGMTTEYICAGNVVDSSNPDDAAAFGNECVTGCTEDLLVCPNGGGSGRDGRRGCNFTPCCCDPQEEPGQFGNPIGREGYACCPSGEWTTNNLGDGRTFFCPDSAKGTTGPFGRRCVD